MEVVAINPADPRADRLSQAVAALEDGRMLAVPTETFYGLAVDAFRPQALDRLNKLKRKAADTPILLLLAGAAQASQVSDDLPETFQGLTESFWPGPLTLVVPASADLPRQVTGGGGTVAVRTPGLALPRRLAAGLGRPISGISANLHGEPPCRVAVDVARAFPEGLDGILDGGPTSGGAPSTILDLTASPPRILRQGLVPASSIRSFLSDLVDAPV